MNYELRIMKNYSTILLLMWGLTCFFACQQTEQKTDTAEERTQPEQAESFELTAIYSSSPLQIDGQLDEAIYSQIPKIPFKNSETKEDIADSAYATYAQICYDETYLYIAFSCKDKDIHSQYRERDQYLWEEEAVEVFIDVDDEPNNYVELEVSPHNILFDSYIVDPQNIDIAETLKYNMEDIHTAVSVVGTLDDREDEDQGWIVEIAVPLRELDKGYSLESLKSASWKINFYRLNLDDYADRAFAWSPIQGSFHQPDKFGTLRFE